MREAVIEKPVINSALKDRKRHCEFDDDTTDEIRRSSTDDIACWFIDTDYNEESFFVRHAYFTGADQPCQNLQSALKAETDEEAWASLYQTVSQSFEAPSTGKITVNVINHYGYEVLKVYECVALSGGSLRRRQPSRFQTAALPVCALCAAVVRCHLARKGGYSNG